MRKWSRRPACIHFNRIVALQGADWAFLKGGQHVLGCTARLASSCRSGNAQILKVFRRGPVRDGGLGGGGPR